jgi:hypothetical protein
VKKEPKRNISVGRAIGDGVITTGTSNLVIAGGDIVGRNVHVTGDVNVISGEQAIDRIGAAARLNLSQLERNIEQAREESGQFFRLTLIFAGLGFAVVLCGVGLLLFSQITAGVVASAASIIPEVTAALFFRKDKELRQTIEAYHQHMLDSQRILTMVDVASTMTNGADRDKMKQEIILRVLSIKA